MAWGPADSSAWSSLVAWYDADDSATISDTGGAVDQWDDKKNSNDLTASGSARPTTGSVTVGGLNAIDFNGSSHRLVKTGATDIGTGAQPFTVIVIAQINGSPSADGCVFAYGTNTSGALIGISQVAPGGNELTGRFFNGYAECDDGWTAGDVQIGVMKLGASENYNNIEWRIDGSDTGITNNNSNSLNLSSTKNLVLGDYATSGSDLFDGAYCEVLFFDSELSQTEIEEFEGYVAHKWGQEGNLPAAHPYKSAPPSSGSTVSGDGASDGTSTVSGAGLATATGSGASDGAATASGEGAAIVGADGASDGVATATGDGGASVVGGLAVQEAGTDTLAGVGAVGIVGALSAAEVGTDSLAGTGAVGIVGDLSAAEVGTDGFSASGIVSTSGSISVQETGPDAFSGTGSSVITGTASTQETGSDAFSGTGSVSPSGIAGVMAAQETGLDVFAASGTLGAQPITGTLAAQETGSDVFAASGTVIGAGIVGTLAVQEAGPDDFSANGTLIVVGDAIIQESGADVFAGTGTVALIDVSGTMAAQEIGLDIFRASAPPLTSAIGPNSSTLVGGTHDPSTLVGGTHESIFADDTQG